MVKQRVVKETLADGTEIRICASTFNIKLPFTIGTKLQKRQKLELKTIITISK